MKLFVNFLFLISLSMLVNVANAQSAPASSADSTKAYAGSYTFASGSPVQKYVITAEKGEIYGAADDYGKNKLVKQAKVDTYKSTSSYGSIITFVRDATTKAVTGLTMAIQGSELTAKKDNP
ncbi:DUF3471 domain-containing protein [Spirosoma validum]|uniref:DUF3471 domain-containing protein n=1 Tax=Spirosoma validum TaxID=2771355 RepID=A0A927B696_9BACT|nr:DUF3471 domain-containing protein [Spirosoma validum]MBD2756048.1 DUF3471 domain-containing protein [Spirosoma validum]